MSADGLPQGNRVTNFSHSEVHAVVMDAILNDPTMWARINGQGKKFRWPTQKYTVKVSRTGLGQTFRGLEVLNSSAADTTIQLEYNHVGYSHPTVKILLEHMENENDGQDINLSDFINQEAVAEIHEDLGSLIYGVGVGDNIIGLEKIVDDGTNASTIGGQSRTTYSQLNSTVTASGGTVSLSKMGTLWFNVASGSKKPTIGVTTETIWQLLESLLQPQIRQEYKMLPVRGMNPVSSDADIQSGAGFTSIQYRGVPIIYDEFATSGVLYFLNENYLEWYGRTSVPSDFKGKIAPVKLGKLSTLDTSYTKPSDFHGWFFQEEQMMPHQAGMIGRYYVIGQVCSGNPRYHGKLTGITSV